MGFERIGETIKRQESQKVIQGGPLSDQESDYPLDLEEQRKKKREEEHRKIMALMEETDEAICVDCGKPFAYHLYRSQAAADKRFIEPAPSQCVDCRRALQVREEEERERQRQAKLEEARDYLFLEWLDASGIPPRYQESSFETFERKLQAQAFDMARKYAFALMGEECAGMEMTEEEEAGLPPFGSLMLSSQGNGTGKTHLATAIAVTYLKVLAKASRSGKGRCPVLFTTVTRMHLRLRATYRDGAPETEQDVIDDLSTVPLLVLDDIGKEKPSDAKRETYFTVIDARYGAEAPMIITSNLVLPKQSAQLALVVGEACMSRLKEMTEGWRVVMDGPDYRFRTKEEA